MQEYERAYELLRRFDRSVDAAQSNFHNVNTEKLNHASELLSITLRGVRNNSIWRVSREC